jgi:hypothetical protein
MSAAGGERMGIAWGRDGWCVIFREWVRRSGRLDVGLCAVAEDFFEPRLELLFT